MGRKPSTVRDPSKLSQKPLRETIIPSVNIILNNTGSDSGGDNEGISHEDADDNGFSSSSAETEMLAGWVTSRDLVEKNLPFTQDVMYSLNNFLLGNPNMNSSQLFRADILFDSAGKLKTPKEKEALQFRTGALSSPQVALETGSASAEDAEDDDKVEPEAAPRIPGFVLKRTVVRKLIPRNPNVDRPLNQTCHYYEGVGGHSPSRPADSEEAKSNAATERTLYMSLPHVKSVEDVPFYHPRVRGLAFLYEYQRSLSPAQEERQSKAQDEERNGPEQTSLSPGHGALSVHFLPFPATEDFDPFATRLERILQNLLSTHIRLARNTHPTKTPAPGSQHDGSMTTKRHEDDSYNPDKDNILPRHMVQNTYARLKLKYSRDLCQRWVEVTEPSKHVFEDLLITAFLIELWRSMYGVAPMAEKEKDQKKSNVGGEGEGEDRNEKTSLFPGFVDIACGNGVLVYVLLMEGYQGWGFDARRRKTWSIFPDWIQSNLKESIYIPKPFLAAVKKDNAPAMMNQLLFPDENATTTAPVQYNTADLPQNTFIISNHADELTVWTPLLAALACPEDPLPFLSIPCCSHSLSGARFRYPPPKKITTSSRSDKKGMEMIKDDAEEITHKTGDLKALRAAKQAAGTSFHPGSNPNSTAVLNSMYGSLTAKTMSIAEEIGYGVEKTMLRIPSTRNMGVIGGRIEVTRKWQGNIIDDYDDGGDQRQTADPDAVLHRVNEIVERECAKEGGVYAAAKIWIERAVKLQKGKNL